MTEREIDNLLEMPTEDIVTDVTPSKRAMDRIVAGIVLSTITFRFLCLDYIFPAVGMIALLLGFRTLRSENKWFYRGYISTIIRAVCLYLSLILKATIFQKNFQTGSIASVYIVFNIVLAISTFYYLWRGIRAVQQKADIEPHAESAVALIIWYLIICACSIVKINGMVIVAGLVIAYFFIIRSLRQLAREMDKTGYLVEASEVKFCDSTIIKAVTCALAIGMICGYVFFGSYPMNWIPVLDSKSEALEEITEVKDRLINLGFPTEVLDDMSDDEILAYKDASQVIVDVNEYPFNDGREVEEKYLEERFITTVYDVKELKVTDVAVKLSDGKTWVFLHYFLWQHEPEYMGFKGFHGTESIQIWPVYYYGNDGWKKQGDATGRLLYEKNNMTYSSEYYYLGEQIYTSDDVFLFGEKTCNNLFAAFSLSKEGDSKRGYIMYQAEELEEGWVASSWFNYTHQMHFLQYPVKTAMEKRMENGWNDAGAFMTVQDAFQFYETDEGVELAED